MPQTNQVEIFITNHIRSNLFCFFFFAMIRIKKTMHYLFAYVFIDLAAFLIVFVYSLIHRTTNVYQIIGTIIALLGLWFRLVARIHLGNAFALDPQAKKLVTNGIYAKIRNPIYVFSLIAFSGVIVSVNKPLWFIVVIAFFALQALRVQKEKKILFATFGEEYKEYRKKTRF